MPAPTPNDANVSQPTGSRDTSCPELGAWDQAAVGFEDEVLRLVNVARAQGARCGTTPMPPQPPLTRSVALACVARAYAQRMYERDFFSHTGDDGSSVADRVGDAKIKWRGVGENIASGQQTPADVMQSWLTSEGHCRNVMGEFSLLGVGYYRGLWVQDFVQP